ncbi:MAG: D-glycero-beta-D-manno-heptose-7-phosphate kinase [Candidatus Cloacimonadaceae bacterium]|nr:D-glycero-beta-D-manno-heptose-7-phosphate kinase [Candidatus Cloacimonadaceae bacterium]
MKVIVLGDIMLDHYVRGRVERISPEAPVPVIEVQNVEYRLGGAANVALNLHSLGAGVQLIGICGNDSAGIELLKQMADRNMDSAGIITLEKRPTTLKTRITAANQQIVRIDYEDKTEIPEELQDQILQILEVMLDQADALIIEDYNKGLLTGRVIKSAISLCRERGIPVAVDPKQKHFFDYLNVDIFKPNYSEMQTNLGTSFDTEEEFLAAAKHLRERIDAKYLIVTRGAKGMSIFGESIEAVHLPTCAREVFDVSGAGDTVISVLAIAYAVLRDILTAAETANHAAGVVCGKQGTAAVSPQEILESYHDRG